MIIKWHVRTGYREYQRTAGVAARVLEGAEKVAAAAGGEREGYAVDFQPAAGSRKTPRASVRTATKEARVAEARDRRLTRALDAGRE